MMNVLEHRHSLKLIDLHIKNPKEEDEEEDAEESNDEEEKNLVAQDEFVCLCKRCDQEINVYYRYYYKCINDSCKFSLHKFCAELPTTLNHTLHPIPLKMHKEDSMCDWTCDHCRRKHGQYEVFYSIGSWFSSNYLKIDVNCAVDMEKKKIQHPSHPHPLVSLISKPILCECSACGKEHKGVFLQCTTCSNFAIHNDCVTLPKKLLIQNTTNNNFHHTHPLTLSYSFLEDERIAKHYPNCRVCDGYFKFRHLWIYKCEKCIYYTHVDCATSRKEPFMSILCKGQNVKNFKDDDYPNLLRLPFADITYNIPKHLFLKQNRLTTYQIDKVSLHQINHQHELVLVDTECHDVFGQTYSKINSLINFHDPMKKIELLCNGCLRPIMGMPFYKCRANIDENCNFTLHEWCTRLPTKIENHPGHRKHTLVFMPRVSHLFLNVFSCHVCSLPCNGFAYGCVSCEYYVDVTCGLMPENITHESHPNHLLKVKYVSVREKCLMCHEMADSERYLRGIQLAYSCSMCDVCIHPECALLLPKTIRHVFDKHPMHLSYLPSENHKSEYFCEICEDGLNPHSCFYHCDACVQSVHTACAHLIQCETETRSKLWQFSVYNFLNMKFGSIHKIRDHPHSLIFAQGIIRDGRCSICSKYLRYKMIFKCVHCEFAIDYECCKHLSKNHEICDFSHL